MTLFSNEQMQTIKRFIFQNGRLLERQLFDYFFGGGTRQACVRALLAYQNDDGGFGNGIEPDLLCPESTAIGAETAMYVMDSIDYHDAEALDPLLNWITEHQNADGVIPHPPASLLDYPYQPWWKNPDPERVLTLAGLLKKWGVNHDPFHRRVRGFYEQMEMPAAVTFYGYPSFVYLKYCAENAADEARRATMIEQLPTLLEKHADHFPLFSRSWCHAADYVARDVLVREATKFAAAIQDDGGLKIPYPDLPWWRPIATLDGLIALEQFSLL